MNKEKNYQAPRLENVPFDAADVLCASPYDSYGPNGDGIGKSDPSEYLTW